MTEFLNVRKFRLQLIYIHHFLRQNAIQENANRCLHLYTSFLEIAQRDPFNDNFVN